MFSPLARGKASWDGDLQCETYSDQTSPIEPLLPHLTNHSSSRNKSARSSGSLLLEDGQLALPKTFVTRKGAILLFTPSDEVYNHSNEESHFKKENVFEAGLKLRTVGNLTNSVLEFGKEEEEAWEGVSDYPKEASEKGEQPKRDKASFLRFLHYLDSENLTADKNVQPGADPDYYLEELKKARGQNSHRRFRSQTPFSTRTSYSTNNASHYSHFLDDDDEITGIIQEYMKYGKPAGWSHSKEHLEHRIVSSDHMPDIGMEGRETLEDFSHFSSPGSPRTNRGNTITFSPSMPSMAFGFATHEAQDSISRPKTAPIPPTLESPRANPRITSGKPPPLPRALGSTPNHLDEIINADVGFGRFHRRGPNPRMRLSRSPSPSFQLGSSRGTTPDFATKVQRLAASPDGKTEEWNRTANVIEEEDEAPSQFDQTETGERSRRPSSAASPRSGREEKVGIQRRASSAGTTNRITRSSLHSSRSASYSSVSHYNRGQSARSRDVERVGSSPDLAETDRDEASPTWPGMRDDFFILQDDMADHVDGHPTGRVSGDTTHSEMPSQAREKLVKSPSPPPRSPSVTSRVASASPRSPSVQSRHETIAKSRGSSAISSSTSEQWQDAIKAAAEEDGRKSSSSVRERHIRSRQSGPAEEEDAQDGTDIDTRTSSAKTAQEGTETRATLGSEADLAQVSETIVRSQPVVEGVYEYLLPEEETADQEWPCISEGGEFDWPDETIESDDKNGIEEELTISTRDGPPEKEFPSALPVNTKGSSDPGPAQPETLTEATELEEEQQETPTIEVHKDEALTSVSSLLKPHESETTPSSIETQELKETETVVVQSSQPVEKFIADTAIHDDSIAVVQDSALPLRVKEVKDSLLSAPEKPTSTPATVPRSSSPAPIKAEQILHKELLPEARLELVGEVDDNRPPSPYKETIDIEKSRPSSPITEDQRSVPVSIGEAVRNYIESGQEPQIRDRSTRSRRGSESRAEEKDIEAKAVEKSSLSSMEKEQMSLTKPEAVKPKINKQSKPISSNVIEKPFGKNKAESKPDHSELNLLKSDDKAKEVKEPTDEEREARRQIVSSLLNKHDAPRDGKLELEGIGKEGEGIDSSSGGLVTRTSPLVAEKKNDLSDLAALVNKNKTPSKLKERKADSKKKSGKHGKSAKKKDEITVDPENIDFEAFNTPDMLDGMDDELRQFIEEQSKATSATDNQPSSSASAVNYTKTRKESVQTLDMPQVAREVPLDKKDAHAPSKPKKLTKKELAKIRADQRKEERKKKDEEKRMREEEMRLLKEREEEAALAKAEAEEKQRNIEEEKMKRLVEEEEAKQQEQEALERLKEAKKKAREERELRRAAEAERRRLEVQKKREEKKKREEELREREKELEQQKMNREKRMAEIEEARRRKEEMERLEEEQRREEERLLELQREEEERMLEEEKIREAEEELRRLQEEREYREQMRRIAEMQEAKLRQEEEERLRREEAERQRAEDERRGREEAEQERLREEQRRIEMARRLEALARMRSTQAAARRKALLLKRREDNVERMQSLKHTRCGQGITRAFVFTYYTHIPRKIWEVPIGFTKKKKGFGSPRRKPAPPKPP